MPDFSTINSGWALAAFALFLLIPHAVTYVQGRRTKALAAKAAVDAAKTREQTENEHQDHPTPNMRQQLDAQDGRLERIEGLLSEHIAHAETVDQRRDAWQTSVEDDLSRLRRPILSWRR